MANEIRVLESDGDSNFSLLFLYPIATPKQFNSANVVPTPASSLTGVALTAVSLTGMNVTAALNAGTMAYEIVSFRKDPALNGAALTSLVQSKYASSLAVFQDRYANRYLHIGTVLNAP